MWIISLPYAVADDSINSPSSQIFTADAHIMVFRFLTPFNIGTLYRYLGGMRCVLLQGD